MLWTRVHGVVAFFAAFDVADEFPEFSKEDGALLFFESTQDAILEGLGVTQS
jgi:hypothetical protein